MPSGVELRAENRLGAPKPFRRVGRRMGGLLERGKKMTCTLYQFEILVIGVVAFLLEFASGTLLAQGSRLGSGIALVLSIIAWVVTYRITAGRSRHA
jgi:hypothetical protein